MKHSLHKLRYRAEKAGYAIRKSNGHKDSIDNLGGYMIVTLSNNSVAFGSRFELDLDDVAAFLDREAA